MHRAKITTTTFLINDNTLLILDCDMAEDLSLDDITIPKCYIRVTWMFDYVIDDLEKPLLEFLRIYCPTAFHQIIYDNEKVNHGQLIESTDITKNIFSCAEKIDISIAHYIKCSFQELENLFPYSFFPTDTSPLFFLHQITIQDGTLLAIGIHHQFSDGHGIFTLIDRFSSWIRQKDHPKVKPFIHNRSLLKPAAHIHYNHPEYTTVSPVFPSSGLPTVEVLVKKYTKRELFEKLNISANNVTLNDVLVAWLTQTISQIRQIPSYSMVNLAMAYNGRNEWGVGSGYFGNCAFFISIQFSMIDLNTCSVNELAQLVNINKKKSMSRDYMASALAYVKSASEKVQLNIDPFCGKNLTFSNWCQFPLYQVDFGRGIPKRVAFPLTPMDGCILIIPTSTDEVELFICLREEHAHHLLKRLESI